MANTFTPITSKPTKSDKYSYLYNNSKNGGKSYCITGKPVDKDCNVLCNCVGWACGRFNHIYNLLTGYSGIKYPNFCCNAENFIEVAKNYGLSTGNTPKPGAIMVWRKGTLASSDGAGHVAVVEKVISSDTIVTSESGYNSFAFASKQRCKGSGNWGAGSAYTFRGFIYNPAVDGSTVVTESTTTTTYTGGKDETKNQILVLIPNLRIRTGAGTNYSTAGTAKQNQYYTYYETKSGSGYIWYRIGVNQWIASGSTWTAVYPAKTTSGNSCNFVVGDAVTMQSGAPIYGKTTKFASWVYKSTLYVRSISGNRVCISVYKSGPLTGNVDKKYLTKK